MPLRKNTPKFHNFVLTKLRYEYIKIQSSLFRFDIEYKENGFQMSFYFYKIDHAKGSRKKYFFSGQAIRGGGEVNLLVTKRK